MLKISQSIEGVYKEKKNKTKRGRINLNKKKTNHVIKFRSRTKIQFSNRIKKIGIALILLVFNILGMMNVVQADTINSANLYSIGDCGKLLTYKGVPIKVSYIEYTNNGIHYPAYCMDKTKPGAETNSYTVSIQDMVKDVGLWRRIVNGYPYKTPEELGVVNKEEAFTATKQAVYCYIHGNNPADYGAIGEAGSRTLNAMNKIINEAQNSTETKISSTITINKDSNEWKQDVMDKNYVSKIYYVQAGSTIQNYKIILTKENGQDLGGIKLTDENNQEKLEFHPSEKFKVLIPIKNMIEKGSFNLKVEAKVKTKPILYGVAPDSSYQDYALTSATFEDGTGNIKDEYDKNETKIVIVKKDQDDGKLLEGVEFELLNEKKEVVYTGLKTDSEGKIMVSNLVPGTYYLKETKTVDGYEIYDQLIKVDIELNQEVTVTVHNRKEEKPKIETKTQKSKSVATKEVKRLPITGM